MPGTSRIKFTVVERGYERYNCGNLYYLLCVIDSLQVKLDCSEAIGSKSSVSSTVEVIVSNCTRVPYFL